MTLCPQCPPVWSGYTTNVRNLNQIFLFWSKSGCLVLYGHPERAEFHSYFFIGVKFGVHSLIQSFAQQESQATIVSMGGSKGDKGGKGGKGSKGGNAAKKGAHGLEAAGRDPLASRPGRQRRPRSQGRRCDTGCQWVKEC